jgi:hypothetical protein
MKKNPTLTIVKSPSSATDHPPTLGDAGRTLWIKILSAHDIQDAAGLAMLEQACIALDRAEMLRAEIERDGQVIRVRGNVRDHPALKHELANRAFVVRTLTKLGLDVEPVRLVGRPPRGIGWQPP